MAEKSFAVMPAVSIQRSKFDRVSTHKTAIRLGDLVPIYCDEVLPGDTRSIDFASVIRMSTPIAPIMDDVYFELFAFFVPMRLTWNHWKEFCGENNSTAGYSEHEYVIPQTSINYQFVKTGLGDAKDYCLGQYLGVLNNFSNTENTSLNVSELPARAYFQICNRWFRNENLEAPKFIDIGDTANSTNMQPPSANLYLQPCWKVSKKADYFTKALPYAQKGQPVMLPLGTSAPIIGAPTLHSLGSDGFKLGDPNLQGLYGGSTLTLNTGGAVGAKLVDGTEAFPENMAQSTNLVADLSQATAATINQLREAYALQLALERDAHYGTRYWEILYGHFGVTSPDATLQDPEFLGSTKINVNIEQVLQTTGYVADESSALGAIGANSITGKGQTSLFTKSFVEHGYIFIMAVARHRESYGQGIDKMFTRKRRFDFYYPEFAHLGAQPVYTNELFNLGEVHRNDIFGYQEAWAEYRYKANRVSSIMNPSNPNSLDFWTLASKFDAKPTLSTNFTKVNRNSLGRALTTGEGGYDFICDFFFKDTAVRPMPLYSIPGLLGEL